MTNNKPRAPRKSTTTSKDKRANGEGSIYWDKSKKRWIGAAYDINGKLRFKGMYSKGLKSGIWIYFEDGRTVRTETYKGGRLTKTDKR